MKVDFHLPDRDNLWLQPLILDLRLRSLGIKDRMVLKHPISADVDPDMPSFPDIYGFEGLPIFPPEIATFTNGTLNDFSKMFKKWQNYYVTDCLRKHNMPNSR